MFNYVTSIGGNTSAFFRVVPGVSDSIDGYNPCNNEIMNGGSCAGSGSAVYWKATDNGNWWLRDTPYSFNGIAQPSDNYTANCK